MGALSLGKLLDWILSNTSYTSLISLNGCGRQISGARLTESDDYLRPTLSRDRAYLSTSAPVPNYAFPLLVLTYLPLTVDLRGHGG